MEPSSRDPSSSPYLSRSLAVGECPLGIPGREELLHGGACDRRSRSGDDIWRPGGLERVYAFALFLRHIGPPVIVTAEHLNPTFLGYALSGVTPGRRETLQSVYRSGSAPLGTN
jgi:hypothetical protein